MKNKYDLVEDIVRIMCSSTDYNKRCMRSLCKYHYSNNNGDLCHDECVDASKKTKDEMRDFIVKEYNL